MSDQSTSPAARVMASFFGSAGARFLLAGGVAASLNFGLRFPLSTIMPYGLAVAVAQIAGFALGFWLYRRYVFFDATTSLRRQAIGFLGVNAASAVVVVLVAIALRDMLVRADIALEAAEALAHFCAIGAGALANFVGHRTVTFAR